MLTATKKSKIDMNSGVHDKPDSYELDNERSQGVLGDLPEFCIATILSCLPPREVAKLARVCRSFRAASNFDSVWERMLPPTYKDILALRPDVVPAQIGSSKREIFDRLCKPMFCANNTQGLWIDHNTGGVCLSMAARGLHITWADDYRYWNWVPDPNSLFPEVARLKYVCWFEAKGELECSLPPGAYTFTWRMYLGELHGWHSEPAHFTFSKNDDENLECKCYIDPRPHVSRLPVEHFSLPTIRVMGQTGWTEYDVGEFRVEEGEQTCVLKFAVDAIHSGAWKSGLFLDGVVVRPTEVVRQLPPRDESGFHTRVSQPEGTESQFPEVVRRFFTNLVGRFL